MSTNSWVVVLDVHKLKWRGYNKFQVFKCAVSSPFDSVDDDVLHKQDHFAVNSRRASGGYSAKRCPTTNSKVARNTFIDSRRTQRIAAMTQNVLKVLDDDTSESTSSEDEYSDTDSDYSSDDSSNGG